MKATRILLVLAALAVTAACDGTGQVTGPDAGGARGSASPTSSSGIGSDGSTTSSSPSSESTGPSTRGGGFFGSGG